MKKFFSFRVINRMGILVLFAIGSFLLGCQKETSWDFLDLSGNEIPSAKDIFAMQEAQKRADKYVTVENGKYKLSISSGSEIAVSDQLFNMAVVRAIESSNATIESREMYIYDRALIKEGEEPVLVTRINRWGVEDENILEDYYNRTWAGTTHVVRFNQVGAREYYNSHFGGSPSATIFSGAISIGLGYICSANLSAVMRVWGTTHEALMQSIGGRVLEASGEVRYLSKKLRSMEILGEM